MKGKIFNIQKFCTHDGPGIRTTVFFKGCPLRCVWCHNPESHLIKSELMYDKGKCINCLRCTDICSNDVHKIMNGLHSVDLSKCVACGKCISLNCGALELSGYEASVDEIIREVVKDVNFYNESGGGITLSGGEPLYQADFCLELLKSAKENNLHICMETCGFADTEIVKAAAEYVDLFLFDYKISDAEKHKLYTGAKNDVIISNLKVLDNMEKKIILRCPIIPIMNDCDNHFRQIAQLSNNLKNIVAIELEPYHNFGAIKYTKLGKKYSLQNVKIPSAADINSYIEKIGLITNCIVKNT